MYHAVIKKENQKTGSLFLYIASVVYQTLISTSTPLGNSSFISASTVLELVE